MILQPVNVELTKVHYYDKCKNVGVSSISREVFQNEFNRNIIIKKNIFGHRWVLKVNENPQASKKKSKWVFVIYVLVFCCIVVAVAFGVFFSIERRFSNKTTFPFMVNETDINITFVEDEIINRSHNTTAADVGNNISLVNSTNTMAPALPKLNFNKTFCMECNKQTEVCLKKQETDKPKCYQIINKKDPTGCGGLCKINTQYCQMLDNKTKVYQCSHIKNILKCPQGSFNCGNRCISIDKKCDGILHCSNKSDELNCDCNLETHFRCGNLTSCISNTKKCDGIIDCWDKSDEKGCKERCSKEEFPCLNGQCIAKEQFCDSILHCQDGSDELQGCI